MTPKNRTPCKNCDCTPGGPAQTVIRRDARRAAARGLEMAGPCLCRCHRPELVYVSFYMKIEQAKALSAAARLGVQSGLRDGVLVDAFVIVAADQAVKKVEAAIASRIARQATPSRDRRRQEESTFERPSHPRTR